VARARVEEAMAAVAERAIEVRLTEREASSHGPVEHERADQRADGDEGQRMREVAMELEKQQRIRSRLDQRVEVRCHAGDAAEHRGIPHLARARTRLRPARAERGLAYRIQRTLRTHARRPRSSSVPTSLRPIVPPPPSSACGSALQGAASSYRNEPARTQSPSTATACWCP